MSWKPEVIADSTGHWCSNALRFATKAESDMWLSALEWTLVTARRSIECADPVNYEWKDGRAQPVACGRPFN